MGVQWHSSQLSQIDIVGGSRHYDESVPICPVIEWELGGNN